MEIKSKVIQHTFRNKYLKYAGSGSTVISSSSGGSGSSIINKWFYEDEDGNLHTSYNFIGDNEISAYGAGSGSSSGDVTIIDNLTSTAIDCALSANMGRYLKGLIDNNTGGVSSWNDLTDKPSTFTPSVHTHTIADITNMGSASVNYANSAGSVAWGNVSGKPSYYSTNWLESNSQLTYGADGLNYFNASLSAGSTANENQTPTADWWHIIRMNHANSGGYYVDLAFCFHSNYAAYRRIANGVSYGWIRLLDSSNYNSYSPTLTGGGASGTWGINITGNATTATKVMASVSGTGSAELVRGDMADNDQFRILVGGTGTNAGYVEIATADDGTEPIYVRQYTGVFSSLVRTLTLLDGSGNSSFPANILAAGEITAYSDARLKSHISPLNNRGYITPVSYEKDGKPSIGFIAQEVQKLYPELVTEGTDENKYLSLNYSQYVAVLQAQIIELKTELDDLKTKLTMKNDGIRNNRNNNKRSR